MRKRARLSEAAASPSMLSITRSLVVPSGFDLAKAVCSYGYFMLPPNKWLPADQAFERPLRTVTKRKVTVKVSQCTQRLSQRLTLAWSSTGADADGLCIEAQVHTYASFYGSFGCH